METYYDRVYELVRQIPAGQVATYGQIAVLLGSPAAARATGYALNALDVTSDIPWWRVVNAKGEISPRSGGGPELQRELLRREGVYDGAPINLRQFRWNGFDAIS
jgi:methylated-DNA-protein-cysteine methyltransferase-like protein